MAGYCKSYLTDAFTLQLHVAGAVRGQLQQKTAEKTDEPVNSKGVRSAAAAVIDPIQPVANLHVLATSYSSTAVRYCCNAGADGWTW